MEETCKLLQVHAETRSGSLLHSPSGGVVPVVRGGAVVRMSGVLVLPVDSVKMICKTYVLYHCTIHTRLYVLMLRTVTLFNSLVYT